MQEYKYTELLGRVFVSVENVANEQLIFTDESGYVFRFYHCQDCCELVEIIDINGNLNDLVGSPLLMASEVTYVDTNPRGVKVPDDQESFTWTFYKFATVKGYVTVRWYGESNGYYSEKVDFERVTK